MTEITSAPGAAAASARQGGDLVGAGPLAASSNGAEQRGRAVAEADFETFLSLLTAQMRNQDPLKPLESTEFVAQLASFSAVEQQIRSNERLDEIFDALSGGPGAGLADWIGMEAETTAAARHEGGPLDLKVSPAAGADRAALRSSTSMEERSERRRSIRRPKRSRGTGASQGRRSDRGPIVTRSRILPGSRACPRNRPAVTCGSRICASVRRARRSVSRAEGRWRPPRSRRCADPRLRTDAGTCRPRRKRAARPLMAVSRVGLGRSARDDRTYGARRLAVARSAGDRDRRGPIGRRADGWGRGRRRPRLRSGGRPVPTLRATLMPA